MKPVTTAFYRPWIEGLVLSPPAPRRDHGSRTDVERDGFSVQIINRGEQLSYIDAAFGEVVAEICIPASAGSWIDAETIKLWDRERLVTDEQRQVIVERIGSYWLAKNGTPLRVIHGSQG